MTWRMIGWQVAPEQCTGATQTCQRTAWMHHSRLFFPAGKVRRSLLFALVICTLGLGVCCAQDTWQAEADQLAELLSWRSGSMVGEIGGGKGQLTIAASQRVGHSGKVYTTELDAKPLAQLEEIDRRQKNITFIKASETDTNLPRECCDSIFMRLVYHHFTKPDEMAASLFKSLKAGGRLAVIDEEPRAGTAVLNGVPKNRQGHGVPQKVLIDELTAAGFRVVAIYDDWPSRDIYHQIYCVVFAKAAP